MYPELLMDIFYSMHTTTYRHSVKGGETMCL